MKQHLVIAGAGFAGVYTYTSLSKKIKDSYDITVIDTRNYFLFTPLLHEVATGALGTTHVVESLKKVLDKDTKFLQDTIRAINYDKQVISFKDHSPVFYDVLVMALGSETNFFGTEGAQAASYTLKSLQDAENIHKRFIEVFQSASEHSQSEHKRILSTAIIGGGPTGVELVGETAELYFQTLLKYYPTISKDDIDLRLINSGPSLLKPFSEQSQEYAKKVLMKKGVQVQNNTCVDSVEKDMLITKDGDTIQANTIIWAAGVMPQSVDYVPEPENDRNRLKVNDALQLIHHPNVFVLGDMSLYPTDDGRGLPMLAQVAKQQGMHTAKNISRFHDGKKPEPFEYHQKGNLVSLGQWQAIAELGNLHIYGPLAWFMWRTVYLFNFASWSKRFEIMFDWTMALFSGRDITEVS